MIIVALRFGTCSVSGNLTHWNRSFAGNNAHVLHRSQVKPAQLQLNTEGRRQTQTTVEMPHPCHAMHDSINKLFSQFTPAQEHFQRFPFAHDTTRKRCPLAKCLGNALRDLSLRSGGTQTARSSDSKGVEWTLINCDDHHNHVQRTGHVRRVRTPGTTTLYPGLVLVLWNDRGQFWYPLVSTREHIRLSVSICSAVWSHAMS